VVTLVHATVLPLRVHTQTMIRGMKRCLGTTLSSLQSLPHHSLVVMGEWENFVEVTMEGTAAEEVFGVVLDHTLLKHQASC